MIGNKRRKNIITGRSPVGLIVAVCIFVMPLLCSCTEKPTANIKPSEEEAAEYSEWKYDGGEYAVAKEKNEVVTAHADAGGGVKYTEVSVNLKDVSDTDNKTKVIRDVSDLSEISNKNGDEEFEQKGNYVFFQNLGSDINYEGKGGAEIPVNMEIKYYLDGEEMSPDEIKGKKGHVKVHYNLHNTEHAEVEAEGITRDAYAPFVAVTLVMLEGDSYSNLTTDDCKLSSFNSENVIMAMTLPGMKNNLEYLSLDINKNDIKDSFSFELDTEFFEMGFSTTIVTTNLTDESIDLSELEELKKSLADLKSGGKLLADAGCDVSAGMSDFETYLSEYTRGAAGLHEGVSALDDGIAEINKEKDRIYNGANELNQGITEIDAAYSEAEKQMLERLDLMIEADPDNEALIELRTHYEETYTAIGENLSEISGGSADYTEGVSEFNKGISSIKEGSASLKQGSSALSKNGGKLLEGYTSLKSGVSKYADGVDSFYKDGISKLYDEGAGKINDIRTFVRMMEEADNIYTTYSGIDEGQKSKVTFIIETEKI